MDLEEQTLLYYLKVFNIFLISIIIFSLIYCSYILNKKIDLTTIYFEIEKNEKIENIISKNIKNLSSIESLITVYYFKINSILFKKFIHFGNFKIDYKISTLDLFNIISKPGNVLNKITIVEGWSQKELMNELSKYFKDAQLIPYENIIADTYFFQKNIKFKTFVNHLQNSKKRYLLKFKNKTILNIYTLDEIMIIGSLIEKEGLDNEDKTKISSVIFNRLNNKMKLQIDATVLYAMTNGEYNLNRKLLISDLSFNHLYNTYKYYGLPPGPISYVGKNTLDIIFQNHKTEFLFYFFNNSLNKHIFSKSYKDHIKKLHEYRNIK